MAACPRSGGKSAGGRGRQRKKREIAFFKMREKEEGLAEPRKQALLVCAGAAGMCEYPAPTPCLRPNRPTAGHPLVLAELKLIPTAGILTKGSHGNKALLGGEEKKGFSATSRDLLVTPHFLSHISTVNKKNEASAVLK